MVLRGTVVRSEARAVRTVTLDPMALPTALAPLQGPVFRGLWFAWLAANLTMWMNDVAAAWLMTTLTTSPVMVALVQTASTLPVFLLWVYFSCLVTLSSALVAAHPAAGAYARSMSCAVKLDYARMTTAVAEGDEVAFLPPVSGGSGVAMCGSPRRMTTRPSLVRTAASRRSGVYGSCR